MNTAKEMFNKICDIADGKTAIDNKKLAREFLAVKKEINDINNGITINDIAKENKNIIICSLPKNDEQTIEQQKQEIEKTANIDTIIDNLQKFTANTKHDPRPHLSCIFFDCIDDSKNLYNAAATNGHFLKVIRNIKINPEDKRIKKYTPEGELFFNEIVENSFFIEFTDLSKLTGNTNYKKYLIIDATKTAMIFPNYKRVIPQIDTNSNFNEFSIDCKTWIVALKTLKTISKQWDKKQKDICVDIKIKEMGVALSIHNPDIGEIEIKIAMIDQIKNDKEFNVCFDANYLITCLESFASGQAVIRQTNNDSISPILIEDKKNKDEFCVLMPIRQ